MLSQRFLIVLFWLLFTLSAGVSHAQLVFNISPTGNADVDAGFQEAASFWSSVFDDEIEVNINAQFAPLPGSLGMAASSSTTTSYRFVRNALLADASSDVDAVYTDSLPDRSNFQVYINRTSDNPDGEDSAVPYVVEHSLVRLSRANAKAIGLISPTSSVDDARIVMNNSVNFDFDRSDGIEPGQVDFVGVAIHELGHSLGFTSGVVRIEANVDDDNNTAANSQFATLIDFTRHSDDSFAAGAVVDLTADTRSKYVSFDGGITVGAEGRDHFSTGEIFGDGNYAGHWRDNLGLGILDPTAGGGELLFATELDINALDVIGFDRVMPLKGDVDLSGEVNFFDIAPFITVLSSSVYQDEADVNCDGIISFFDISPFIDILAGQ